MEFINGILVAGMADTVVASLTYLLGQVCAHKSMCCTVLACRTL